MKVGHLSLVLLSVLLVVLAPAAGASEAGISSRLAAAMAQDGEVPGRKVWVLFTDKGVPEKDLGTALAGLESRLDAGVRERRLARGEGPVVSAGDLPVAARYVSAVTATGARLDNTSRWLNACSVTATPDQVAAIAGLPFVAELDLVGRGRYEREAPVEKPSPEHEQAARAEKTSEELFYGSSYLQLDRLNVPAVHAGGLSGAGVTIAMLDSGFDLTHESLAGTDVLATWDFTTGQADVGPRPGEHYLQTIYGTANLSLVGGYSPGDLIGSAPGASFLLARTEVLDDETVTEEDNWIAALEWAEQLGADIVHSSLGYIDWYNFGEMDGRTARITVAAELAAARGVVVVNCVGDMRQSSTWPHLIPPADGRNVLAVGSINLVNQVSRFSSPGPTADGRIKPDVMAPGDFTAVAYAEVPNLYFYGQGTFYASSLVAGVVALLLENDPTQSPAQVGTALRSTASRSLLPDNNFGWGTVNALAATQLGMPRIEHEPLPDVEPGGLHYYPAANLTSPAGVDAGNNFVAWRTNGGDWRMAALEPAGGDLYRGFIPRQSEGTTVDYYLVCRDLAGKTARSPAGAPAAYHSFRVRFDTTGPALFHPGLADQTPDMWPPRLVVEATDDSGVNEIALYYNIVGNPLEGPFPMELVDGRWELDFPWAYGVPGLAFSYRFIAVDGASPPNATIDGPYTFAIRPTRGRVLLVDDHSLPSKSAAPRLPLPADAAGADKSADHVATWLADAGYEVDVIDALDATYPTFVGYDAVVVSSGNNYDPLRAEELRHGLVNWVRLGGRLLVEGGEIAYKCLENEEYREVREEVLHIRSFVGDNFFAMNPPLEYVEHPLWNRPHRLPVPLRVDTGYDWTVADVVEPDEHGRVLMRSNFGSDCGAIAVDDNTCPDGGQVMYLPIDLRRTYTGDGRKLLENAMSYLLNPEPAGPSSIRGRVMRMGQTDHSGIVVRAGRTGSAVTDADGSYVIEGLWGGDYVVSAEAEGFAGDHRAVHLDDGDELPVYLYLLPITDLSLTDEPHAQIPDNNATGVSRQLVVETAGEILGVTVDATIPHYSIGQLTVVLTSPSGTSVTLHNRTGGTTDDLVGNWPGGLLVDGPGSLDDFLGEEASGTWTLAVADHQFGATGTLENWTLNLQVLQGDVADAPGDVQPATRLLGNHPNPFNPMTAIRFELGEAGEVRLDIYDVKGRHVRSLAAGRFGSGGHSVTWNGRDDRGAELSSGIYFCRLRAAGAGAVMKMTLVR